MFRIFTFTTIFFYGASAHAVSVDQEIKSCAAAWNAGKNRDFNKATQLADPKKCPLTHSFMTWKKLRSDKSNASFSEHTRFATKHPDWPWMPALLSKAEKAINNKTTDKEVLNWYEHRHPHTANGAIRYLKALHSSKKQDLLKKAVRRAWHNLDFSDAQQKTLLTTYGKHLQQQDHRRKMESLLSAQKLNQAKKVIPLLNTENKKWALARLAFIEHQDTAHNFLNNTKRTLDLTFDQLRWYRKRDDLNGAHLIKSIPNQHTKDGQWWRERAFFARESLNQGHPQLAYEIMAAHPYSDGAEYADAEFFCGWLALRFMNNPEKAMQHLKQFASKASLPKSKAKASFWIARTYEALNDLEQAEAAYRDAANHPSTYYGMVAARRYEKNIKLKFAKEPTFDPQAWTKFQNNEFVRMSILLGKVGLGVEAEPFLYLLAKQTSKGSKQEKIMGLKVIRDVYSPYLIFGSKDIRYQEADLFPWLYPRRSLDPKARSQGVDQNLIHAVMRQESGFNSRITSPAGAMGMMQLMPKTAAVIAGKKGYQHQDGKLHSDPDYNILLGTHYLKEMLDLFEGSYVLAIAAYNCGPGPVKKWVEKFGDPRTNQIDTIDFIESIPYSETREYVKSVLANFYVYQALEK